MTKENINNKMNLKVVHNCMGQKKRNRRLSIDFLSLVF